MERKFSAQQGRGNIVHIPRYMTARSNPRQMILGVGMEGETHPL
jgi:hypothetical protein